MPLTRPYDDTIRERAQCDTEFRRLLLIGAIENLLAGDVAVGKIRLRHTVNSTIGYEKLGELMGKTPEDIKRMCHPDYDTSVNDLFEIIKHVQQHEGIRLEAKVCSG
ncbi:MAG: transcriptional regulator, partial [Chloroflexi bacterium]|nr:transcriptional regulator [Chloroflexota bacterium]